MILVNLSLPISLSFTYVNSESSSPYVFDASFTVTVIFLALTVRENPMNEHLIVKEEPAEERNETEEVQTNMGSMPIEDYREIVASQSGFDSYDEMYHQGYRIGNGYDKEPEPVVPAWEQKKKVKGFDLHPDVSMAERHTFNLKENEVETVGKKERFRRNIMAIQLLKKCQEENRFATPEEQIILSKYKKRFEEYALYQAVPS